MKALRCCVGLCRGVAGCGAHDHAHRSDGFGEARAFGQPHFHGFAIGLGSVDAAGHLKAALQCGERLAEVVQGNGDLAQAIDLRVKLAQSFLLRHLDILPQAYGTLCDLSLHFAWVEGWIQPIGCGW